MEFQAKLNLISSSKQKGRGINKKELIRIRKWRRDEETRRQRKHDYDETMESKKIEEEMSKIALNDTLRTQIQKEVVSPNKNNSLKSPKSSNQDGKDNDNKPATGDEGQDDEELDHLEAQKIDEANQIEQNDHNINNNATSKLPPVHRKKKAKKESNIQDDFIGLSATTGDIFNRSAGNIAATSNGIPVASDTLGMGESRTSAKVANQARSGFHETGRNFLYTMANNIFGFRNATETSGNAVREQREHAAKSKFGFRKEFDKLKLVAAQKEQCLRKLDEELAMLQEVDDCSELQSQAAEMQLRKLGMKLNTVMIKISEAERSRRTYELNITHIKDESQENHKQLDYLRRNLFLQENLKKKIGKFKEYADRQKDFAQLGLREFMNELDDWKNFLDYQYRHLATLAKNNKENKLDNQIQNNNKEKQVKKQQKAMNRINKLQKLVETNDKEIHRLSEKLTGFENQIEYYEDRFRRIYTATGLNDPDKIINKFFVNKEILTEQTKILESLAAAKEEKAQIQQTLDTELNTVANQQTDHTWREVDYLQEKLQNSQNDLLTQKIINERVDMRTTALEQWMIVTLNKLNHYINQWEIDPKEYNLPDISSLKISNLDGNNENENENENENNLASNPTQMLQILLSYIQTFVLIVQDLQNGTNKFKKRENANDLFGDIYGNANRLEIGKNKINKNSSPKKKGKKARRQAAK